jgi:outer membrane receptor protein involved in Fe transport
MSKFGLLTLIVLTLVTADLFSQSTGKISGKVIDRSTSEPIPFANIFIPGINQGAAADINGNYTILNIKPGVYEVTASVVGYQKVTVTDVRVNVDFTTRLDFELSTGAVDLPAVVVQGERNPLVRQDLTNPTVAITEETIRELPVDQISDVIKLQAGVVQANDGTLHIRGGYGNEIAFTLNGISVNDPYQNQRSIGVATNAIQEVSVSTGTFSAQYGNALSGVVNYVTKEGGERFTFSLRGYSGDYLTNRSGLFTDQLSTSNIDFFNRGRMEGTMGGPVPFIGGGRFYLSSVFENFKGSLYGRRIYSPSDSYLSREAFRPTDSRFGTSSLSYWFNPYGDTLNNTPTGDGSLVPMNTSRNFNIQGNISFKLGSLVKLKYEAVYDQGENQEFSNSYKYNPDGRGTRYSDGLVQSLDLTHTVSDKMFYTLKASYGYNNDNYYLFKELDDVGYLPSIYSRSLGNTFFLTGGTDNFRRFRKTTTLGLKGDMVSQFFTSHEIRAGFELRQHKLNYEGYSVEIGKMNSDGSFGNVTDADLLYNSTTLIRRKPTLSDGSLNPSLYTLYEKNPTQIAAYVQDKIEFDQTLILNAGVRYEYFDPNAMFNPNLSRNLTDSLFGFIDAYNTPAEVKHTLSPRLSVSYPITDRGIIRFSYGHFYQNGSLSSLYNNADYYVQNVGTVPTFGNPNVEPQRSIQYELGLQQQLTEDFKFDLTGFYKDVSNYIYTQTIYTSQGREYRVLTNLAYSNVRGVTLSFLKRRSPSDIFSATLDYTFSMAEGNRTEPSEELFFSEQSGKQSETFLVPLSFDRRHVINASIGLSQPGDWSTGLIFTYQTGTPYTPSLPSDYTTVRFEQRSAFQPTMWNVDLKLEKFFKFGPLSYSVFLQVENLFDTQNELVVYQSTGRALTTIDEQRIPVEFSDMQRRIERGDTGMIELSQLQGYYSNRPERVNVPREVRLGFSILFN